MSVMHGCPTGINGLYSPLMLGTVNDADDADDLATSVLNVSPGVCMIESAADSGNRSGTICSERAIASA